VSSSAKCPSCGRDVPGAAGPAGTSVVCPGCRAVLPAADRTVSRPADSLPSVGSAAATAPVGGLVIDGRYEVTKELGRGAFGVVYQARDRKLDRVVAIKMLRQEALASDDAVRRFQDEARILCQVNHPHVLPVFDQGEQDGKHYIVFAFIEGKMVKDVLPAKGGMDPVRAARLVAQLAGALHYVYAKHRVLHRDVKPANMMLADGDDAALYLMDFGLAVCHLADVTRATQDGTVMGTPAYMPPEQARGRIAEIDHRSDVYSAVVVLFQLLTGRVPFEAGWPGILLEIIQTPAPAPSEFRAGLDPALDAIVRRGLAKAPADRFQTGKELADALEGWAAAARTRSAVVVGGPPVRPGKPGGAAPPARRPAGPVEAPNSGTPSVVARTTLTVKPLPPKPPAPPRPAPVLNSLPAEPPPLSYRRPESAPPRRVPTYVFGIVGAVGALLIGLAALVYAVQNGRQAAPTLKDPQRGVWQGKGPVQDR